MIAGHPATRASPQIPRGPLAAATWNTSGRDKKGERRVSETTMAVNHRPPLPRPSISGRSQSLGGLLDSDSADGEAEGASDVVDGRVAVGQGLETRSLEVLLDEGEADRVQQRPPRREERSKSVDNGLDGERERERERSFDQTPRATSEQREMHHDTAYNSEEEGPMGVKEAKEGEQEEESRSGSVSISMSRQNSTTSSENPERRKTFMNRLGKRMKSLMKK